MAVPPPSPISRAEIEPVLAAAVADAARQRLPGKEITPFLLAQLSESTRGRTREANVELLENNARAAAAIARALL